MGRAMATEIIVYDAAALPPRESGGALPGHMNAVFNAVLPSGRPRVARGRPPGHLMERHYRFVSTGQLRDREMLRNLETGRSRFGPPWRRRHRAPPGSSSRAHSRQSHLPFTELLQEDQTLLPPEELRARFVAAGLEEGRPVVTSCGSGVTAAILALALTSLGRRDVALYDGSWAEWGLPGPTPVATGKAEDR